MSTIHRDPRNPVSGELIIGVARMIGIDVVNEPNFLWIAEEAASAPIPPDWQEYENENGETMYYNKRTKKLQKIHPIIGKYMQYYHKAKAFTKVVTQPVEAVDPTSAKLATVVGDVMTRVNRGLPPVTPAILEQLCVLLKVQTNEECYLSRAVKQTVEAYVEKRFNLSHLLDDLRNPLAYLRHVRRSQTKVDVIKQPTEVEMCVECEEKSAVLKCEQCKDFFCQDCYNSTHATGKRRGHITSDVEQLVCASCDRMVATCQCVQCGLFYCDQCFVSTHAARPELHNHLKRVINGLVCLECEHFNATVLCEDCVDLFCTECFIKLHQRGRRRQHVHLTIDNTGQVFRGGFLVPPEEAQILIDKARSTAEAGPWLAFKDDDFHTYWYHLAKKTTTSVSPFEEATTIDGGAPRVAGAVGN
jgi:hypothetical protein